MKFQLTDEMKAKLTNCKTPEDLLDVAREYNLDIDPDLAGKAISPSGRPLSPEEQSAVNGGCCFDLCPSDEECCEFSNDSVAPC